MLLWPLCLPQSTHYTKNSEICENRGNIFFWIAKLSEISQIFQLQFMIENTRSEIFTTFYDLSVSSFMTIEIELP